MANQFPNSGKLSPNKYKDNPKKPDMTGELVMTKDAIKELLAESPADEVTIKLGAWKMQGAYGEWVRLSWNNYKPKAQVNPYVQPKQDTLDDSDIPF
jgi:hypothetical protein